MIFQISDFGEGAFNFWSRSPSPVYARCVLIFRQKIPQNERKRKSQKFCTFFPTKKLNIKT